MLVREGDERNDTIDLWLASSLAGVAGALNAAAFYAVGFFSANMTGNVSTLSDHLALLQWSSASFYVAILVAFVGGAAGSAGLVGAGRRRRRGIYAYAILIEAAMLAALGGADLFASPGWRVPVVVLGLAFAMGFQNAITTRISDGRVRTTHVSGLATDIGIEMAAALAGVFSARSRNEHRHGMGKLRLHMGTLLSFLAGGVVGLVLYRAIGGALFVLAGAVLGGVAASAIARARRPDGGRAAALGEQRG